MSSLSTSYSQHDVMRFPHSAGFCIVLIAGSHDCVTVCIYGRHNLLIRSALGRMDLGSCFLFGAAINILIHAFWWNMLIDLLGAYVCNAES